MAADGPDGTEGPPETVAFSAGDPATPRTPATDETLAWPLGARPAPAGEVRIAGYEILGELGRGGMGVVYKAHDTELNRVVAIKVLPGRGAADPLELARFRIEAETMAAASHPNVVAVYGIRETGGQPCIVMEYVNGGSLGAKLKLGGPLPAAEAARVVAAVARGVAAAHGQGVVHRDLKPGNVLLHLPARREPNPDGSASASGSGGPPTPQPKVADFGLARRGLSNEVTHTGAVLGTPAYMAPEQASGQNKLVGPAVDVYALGVILYECVAGAPPFVGDDHWAVLRQVTDAEPTPLRRVRPDAPRDLELICGKCLEKDPRDRYASADAVADDLANHLAGRPVSVRPVSVLEAGRKWARRNPALARMGAVLALAALTLAAFGVKYDFELRAAARRDRDAALELALSEEKGKVLAAGRQAADRAAEDARRLARSQQFYRQLTVAEVRRFDPTPGWTLDTLADVAELADSPEAAGEGAKLRDIAAAALAAPDLEECAPWRLPESGPFTYPSLLAVHPTEPLAAVARFGYSVPDVRLTVWLVNWRTGVTHTLHAPVRLSQLDAARSKESPEQLAFAPDGRRLVLVSRRGNVTSWGLDDPAAPARDEPLMAGDGPLAFRPDGRGFWKADGHDLRVCDAAGRVLATRRLDRRVTSLAHAAGVNRLVAAAPGWVMALDPDDLSEATPDLETATHFTRAAVAPSGVGGVVGVNNGVSWIDFALGRLTGALDRGQESLGDVVEQPVFSPDGGLVAVPREHSHGVQLFSARTGRLVATVRNPERTHAPPVGFSPDGTLFFVGGQDRLRLFRVRLGALPAAAVGPAPVHGVALDPTGRVLVTQAATPMRAGTGRAAATASSLSAWDAARPAQRGWPLRAVTLFDETPAAHVPSFQPDGPWLAFGVGKRGGVWNLATDESRPTAPPTDHPAQFAPDGRFWRGGTSAAAFEASTGRPLTQFTDTVERIIGGKAETDVLTAGTDGLLVGTETALLNWLSPEGRSLGRWKSGVTAPTAAALRPGVREVFVGHDSGAAAVFRLPRGDAVIEWTPHRGRVAAAVWLSPGELLTGGADRQLHLWRFDGDRATRVWSVRTEAGVKQLLALPGGRVAVLEDDARGVGLLDVPRFHAAVSALIPTEPLRLAATVAPVEPPPLPIALRGAPSAPAAGLRAEFFAARPDGDERIAVASGFVPGLPGATGPPHRDLPVEWFVARYRGFVRSAAVGPHTLTASASGEVKVWLDGSPVGGTVEFALPLTGRPQTLRIEWRHARGDPRLSVAWKSVAAVTLTPDRP